MAMVREVIPPATEENKTNDQSYRLCGVITLEDIAEEIVGAKIAEQSLTNHEIRLIYESILKNIPNLFSYTIKHRVELLEMIKMSEICYQRRQTPDWEVIPQVSDLVVKKGKFINYCIVILEGTVRLEYTTTKHSSVTKPMKDNSESNKSNKGFHSPFIVSATINPLLVVNNKNDQSPSAQFDREVVVLGPYDILCQGALLSNKTTYTANFNAYVEGRTLRYAKLQLNPSKRKKKREIIPEKLMEIILRSRSCSSNNDGNEAFTAQRALSTSNPIRPLSLSE
jgi:hypothetical protein